MRLLEVRAFVTGQFNLHGCYLTRLLLRIFAAQRLIQPTRGPKTNDSAKPTNAAWSACNLQLEPCRNPTYCDTDFELQSF